MGSAQFARRCKAIANTEERLCEGYEMFDFRTQIRSTLMTTAHVGLNVIGYRCS